MADDDCIDLTSDTEEQNGKDAHPYTASSSSASASMSSSLRQQQLMLQQFELKRRTSGQNNNNTNGSSGDKKRTTSLVQPLQFSIAPSADTPPPPSSASSSTAAASSSSVPSIFSRLQQRASVQKAEGNTNSNSGQARIQPLTFKEESTSTAAALQPPSSKSNSVQYSLFQPSSVSPPPLVSAAPMNSASMPPIAPRSNVSPTFAQHAAPSHRSASPLLNSTSSSHNLNSAAAAASSSAVNNVAASVVAPMRYEASEEEKLVERKSELDKMLYELDEAEREIQNKRRGVKAELRMIEDRLNRPIRNTVPALVPSAVGGVSALISANRYWSGNFAWDATALNVLRDVFRIQSYRVSQREVINATLDRKDVFVIMPTGAGKSLLYQLPAMLDNGVTLVISPLLSLMEDQIIGLRTLGIESYMICGTTGKEEAKSIQQQMLDPHSNMKLLYVTPEKIAKSQQFLAKLERMNEMGRLSRVVIDECHCCSNWGHDFRPDYAKLNKIKLQFSNVPILAVTATATEKVVEDCKKILNIRGCQFFKCSFNRPNLHFSVRSKPTANKDIASDMYAYIESIGHLKSSGIVYCYSKKETEEMAALLNSVGLNCGVYHSDVPPEVKQSLHHRWVKGQVKIVVATNAFGLGINKPDVRFVLHHTFPQGLHTYYQEGGRAGRDGLKAFCCVWYSSRDLGRQSIRVYDKQDMTAHLYPMVEYCHSIDTCRRVLMAPQFGEIISSAQCNRMCDICEKMQPVASANIPVAGAPSVAPPTVVFRDLTEAAVSICEFVASTNHSGGINPKGGAKGSRKRKANVGTLTQKQLTDECRKKNSSISTIPGGLSRESCDRLIVELLLQGLLRESFKNTAYSTISYLQHDQHLLEALRRGDLIIKLSFFEGEENNSKAKPKRSKKPKSSAAKSEEDEEEEEEIDEEDPEVEFDDPVGVEVDFDDDDGEVEYGGAAERKYSSHGQARLAAASDAADNEDQPIQLKRLKRTGDPKTATASSSTSRARPQATARTYANDNDDDDFMDEDEDERAYQEMLIESTRSSN